MVPIPSNSLPADIIAIDAIQDQWWYTKSKLLKLNRPENLKVERIVDPAHDPHKKKSFQFVKEDAIPPMQAIQEKIRLQGSWLRQTKGLRRLKIDEHPLWFKVTDLKINGKVPEWVDKKRRLAYLPRNTDHQRIWLKHPTGHMTRLTSKLLFSEIGVPTGTIRRNTVRRWTRSDSNSSKP